MPRKGPTDGVAQNGSNLLAHTLGAPGPSPGAGRLAPFPSRLVAASSSRASLLPQLRDSGLSPAVTRRPSLWVSASSRDAFLCAHTCSHLELSSSQKDTRHYTGLRTRHTRVLSHLDLMPSAKTLLSNKITFIGNGD